MFSRRTYFAFISVLLLGALLQHPVAALAQGKPPGSLPANVSAARVASGQVAPQAEFIGTVFFEEVSEVAAEISGVVIKRHVDRGEWLSEGKTVAVFAKDDVVDIVAQIPERYIQYIRTGMEVKVEVSGHRFLGTIMAVVPRGDIATRTFPVKIRTPDTLALIEGMSAKVILPTGEKKQVLVIPRDALISKFGKTVVFVVDDSKARMIPVNVIGHEGLNAGVEAAGLTKGMQVVVKGNERLRDGQQVALTAKPYQPYTNEGP